mmetsp:Transcript_1517/g.1517  ORF Transcript_1517/g.1517 Transcript_1517/m.1517 type:complete len:508 (+) Transcript_1517:69-1592(+)
MWKSLLLLTPTLITSKYLRSFNEEEPIYVPDYVNVPSEQCTYCKDTIDSLEMKWTNETTVAEILADLESQCKTLPLKERQICDKVVQVLVQIPPGIFKGISSLAWPVSLGICATLNECQVNCCPADSPPEQIHLSLAGTDRSLMGVSWVTLAGTDSYVKYGEDKNNLSSINVGSVDTYTKAGWVGVIHRALMTNLKPATTYYYQVGADDNSGWSEIYSFTTYDPNKELNFAVIADMAYDTNSDGTVADLIKLVDEGQIDVVIHSGDISYADGYMPHFDDFLNKVQPIAARVPYMVTPGNHEFGYNFTAYKSRFYMPGQIDEGGSGDGMYYSWTYGAIHFCAMNSESPIDTPMFSESEMAWVDHDLSSVNRDITPWVVAHFHRPYYCAKDSECGKILINQGGEEVLYKNDVDFVLTGHLHAYERTYPVYNHTKQDDAPIYLMQGASGNREGNDGNYPPLDQLPSWVASAHNEIGYAILTQSADGNEISWKFLESSTNTILDSASWTKK